MALIDSPLLQRLRDIHQTGLAYYVYPSARHSRFEHTLGVVTIASRIFEAVSQRESATLQTIWATLEPKADPAHFQNFLTRLGSELRLAALLHDTGHSLLSHASERVYSKLDILKKASAELTSFVGKEKGAGEVLSFCLAKTQAVKSLLERTRAKLLRDAQSEETPAEVDLENVALLIVGRSKHPYLQFLGDIISGGFDADKLDYLLRDAVFAGLPLKYDVERYLYTVFLHKDKIADGAGKLEQLYRSVGQKIGNYIHES